MNPSKVIQSEVAMDKFVQYVDPLLVPQSVEQSLPPSDVVGNIRFSHPTLYVFPGGQGDSALFGINGFNMLIDGGFSRKSCFWDFSRHLDRLDTVLVTRLSNENTCGMAALLQRKTLSGALYPQIGHVFTNLPSKEKSLSDIENDSEGKDDLIINVIAEGNTMLKNLGILNLKPQLCFRDRSQCLPVNLYHKVGHGRLDMYVLNPSKDAKELKEFMERWHENSKTLGNFKSGISVDGKEIWLPLANLVSICALLIWTPEKHDDTVTRLLFPGSTPQHKILRGFERVRYLESINKPVCLSGSLPRQKPADYSTLRSSSYSYREKSTKRQSSLRAESAAPQGRQMGSRYTETSVISKTNVGVKKTSLSKQNEADSRPGKDKQSVEKTTDQKGKIIEGKKLKDKRNQAAEAIARDHLASKSKNQSSRQMHATVRQTRSDTKTSKEQKSIKTSGASITSKTHKDASNKTKKAAAALSDQAVTKTGIDDKNQKLKNEYIDEGEKVADNLLAKPFEDETVDVIGSHEKYAEDDVEPELLKIKDEDEDHEVKRKPDIPEVSKDEKDVEKDAVKPENLHIVKTVKTVTGQVKTPDEVDDLPEHEAVDIAFVGDVKTSEIPSDKHEKNKNIVETPLDEKSEGIQQERSSSEIIVATQKAEKFEDNKESFDEEKSIQETKDDDEKEDIQMLAEEKNDISIDPCNMTSDKQQKDFFYL